MSSTTIRRRRKTSIRHYTGQRNDPTTSTASTTLERNKATTNISSRVCWRQMKQMPPFLLLLKQTPLIDHLINEEWDAALERLKLYPSEAKTWVELELKFSGFSLSDSQAFNSQGSIDNRDTTQGGSSSNRWERQTPEVLVPSRRFQTSSRDQTPSLGSSSIESGTSTQDQPSPQQYERSEKQMEHQKLNECPSRVLALHVAARCGAPLRVIKALFIANPKAAAKSDSYYDRYPLHFACLHKPSVEVVSFLLGNDGGASNVVFHKDKLHRLPLHYAAFGCANAGVFEQLLNAFPEAAMIPESHGWLPLHVAIKTGCKFDVLRRLVEQYPSSLKHKTKRESTVFQLARRFHGSQSIIESQLHALRAVVEAFYDTKRCRLSLTHLSEILWIDPQQPNDITTFNGAESDVSTFATEDAREESPSSDVSSDTRDSKSSIIVEEGPEKICSREVEFPSGGTEMRPLKHTPSSVRKDCEVHTLESDPNGLCAVCLEENSSYAFVPCGHLCVCRECSILSHRPGGLKCPICRKKAFLVMKVFQS